MSGAKMEKSFALVSTSRHAAEAAHGQHLLDAAWLLDQGPKAGSLHLVDGVDQVAARDALSRCALATCFQMRRTSSWAASPRLSPRLPLVGLA